MALKAEWRGVSCGADCTAGWTTVWRLRLPRCGPPAERCVVRGNRLGGQQCSSSPILFTFNSQFRTLRD